MKFALLIYRNEAALQGASDKQRAEMMAAYGTYTKEMRDGGAFVAGDPVGPSASACTVRIEDGRTKVVNGPYAQTKEQLGGYYVIDVPNIEVAQSWAARCPGARVGVLEVRPIPAY